MLFFAAAAALVVCSQAPDFDEAAAHGRFELEFTAEGDFEFTVRNSRLELEVFEGAGPAAVVCKYSQRVPPNATLQLRLLSGATKPKLSGSSVRFEKAAGPYQLWIEWENDHFLYRSPRPNSALPNLPIRPESRDFDNRLTGSATLNAQIKSPTTLYLRADAIHTSPPLPGARFTLSQPLPARNLARFKASANGCKSKVVEQPEKDNGYTAVLQLTPPKKPGDCELSLDWKR